MDSSSIQIASLFGNSLMVERRSLEPTVLVRVRVPDPILRNRLIGRPTDSDSVSFGSSPNFASSIMGHESDAKAQVCKTLRTRLDSEMPLQ